MFFVQRNPFVTATARCKRTGYMLDPVFCFHGQLWWDPSPLRDAAAQGIRFSCLQTTHFISIYYLLLTHE